MLELDPRWKRLREAADERRAAVLAHPVYDELTDLGALRVFMAHHCWAVWDFMSLLTALQRALTCVTVPWVPSPADIAAQRFVNEIKLGEETDLGIGGRGWISHLDLYRRAMVALGADTAPLDATLAALALQPSADVPALAAACGAPAGSVRFIRNTLRTVTRGRLPDVAAAFALGREQLIPDLFRPILERADGGELLTLYLERHIELDGDEHGPMAHRLVQIVCGDDEERWIAAEHAAVGAIEARHRLWSDTREAIAATR